MLIAIFGGLHINVAVLKTAAENLPESSRWTGALVQAGVATSGLADSFLKASHITPTRRRAHYVTACVLHLAWDKARQEHLKSPSPTLSLGAWKTDAPFSRKPYTDVQVMVPCPAAAVRHTRVCANYSG